MSADLLTKFFRRPLHFSLGYGHIAKQRAQFHQVLAPSAAIAINLQLVEDRVAIHILRYDCRSEQNKVPTLDELNLKLRLPGSFGNLEVFSPSDAPEVRLEVSGDLHLLPSRTCRFIVLSCLRSNQMSISYRWSSSPELD